MKILVIVGFFCLCYSGTKAQQVDDFAANMKSAFDQMAELQKHVQKMETKIDQQENKLKTQEKMIEKQRMTNEEQRMMIEEQRMTNEEQRMMIEEQRMTNEEQQSAIAELQAALKQDNARPVHELVRATGNITDTVAFSVYATHVDGWFTYYAGQTIIFEGVEYNTGNYQPTLSVFQCPVTGLYWFNINLYFDDSPTGPAVDLIKSSSSGSAIITTVGMNDGGNSDQQSSSSVLTICVAGETVFGQAGNDAEIFGAAGTRLSSFNGLLLAQ